MIKMMKFVLFFLLPIMVVLAGPPPPGSHDYVVSAIYVPPEQERVVADLYDLFLTLAAGGKIERGTKFPVADRFAHRTETHIVFYWAYYISPNEVRGFEISVPKASLDRKDVNYVTRAELRVAEVTSRQGAKIFIMKESKSKRQTDHAKP